MDNYTSYGPVHSVNLTVMNLLRVRVLYLAEFVSVLEVCIMTITEEDLETDKLCRG